MSEWKEYRLEELLDITSSKRIMRDEYTSNGIPFYRSKEIIELNSGNKISTELFISTKRFNDIKEKFGVPQEGDILLTSVGTLGVPYLVNETDHFYFKDGNLTWFKNFSHKINSKFLFYWFLSDIGKQSINYISIGSTQKALTIASLKKLTITLPPIEYQEKICSILSDIDTKITLNTQTNQTLEQIAQAIFKHWFIDFAPVHAKANALARGETIEQAELAAMVCLSGKTVEKITALKTQDPTAYHQLQQTAAAFPSEFVETEMGEVPRGWEILKFKDFVKETKEKVGKLQGVEEYSVGNEGIYPRKEKYKKQLAKDPSKNKLIRAANIVFGMGNKEVNWGIMQDKVGSVSSAYNIFQINNVNHLFLEMLINNIPYYFRDIIKPTSRQGQTIDKEAFLEKVIYYPNKEIINIFLEKITQINELSICIKSQNIYLLSIRDYLLPKLLGGEIKL